MKSGRHIAITLAAVCLIAWAPWGQAELGPSTTARKWCEKQTLNYLKKRGYEPYNWTATTYIEGNNYVTEGSWRVDVDDVKVQCTTRKDGKKSSGKYRILNVEILDDPDGPSKKSGVR